MRPESQGAPILLRAEFSGARGLKMSADDFFFQQRRKPKGILQLNIKGTMLVLLTEFPAAKMGAKHTQNNGVQQV